MHDDRPFNGQEFYNLPPVTEGEVQKLLLSKSGQSSLHSNILTQVVFRSFCPNHHLFERCFPYQFQDGTGDTTSQVILRIIGKYPTSTQSVRCWNIYYLLVRLIPHVSANLCQLQSAYCRYHSTNTALLTISNDVFKAADTKKVTVLVTLKLLTAFEATDHLVHLQWLEHTFGVDSLVLCLIRSHLHQRLRFIKTNTAQSSMVVIDKGSDVLQGLSFGPLPSHLLVAPLRDVISRFGILYHQDGNDTPLYIAVNYELARSASTN